MAKRHDKSKEKQPAADTGSQPGEVAATGTNLSPDANPSADSQPATPSTALAPVAEETLDSDSPALQALAFYDAKARDEAQAAAERAAAASLRLARLRGFARKSFNVASDMTGRMAVTSVLKIAAGSFVVGAGLSAVWGAAIAVGAAAVGSAAYTYTRETYTEWRARQAAGEQVTFFNVLRNSQQGQQRLRRTLTSLACGVAFGALGAWAMQSDFAHTLMSKAGNLLGLGGAGQAAGAVAHAAAAPAPLPAADIASAVVPGDTEALRATAAAVAATAHHSAAEAVAGVTLDADVSPLHAAPGLDAAHEAVHAAGQQAAVSPLTAALAQAGIPDADSVSAQALKDAAHNVLRDHSIAAAERVDMARALAQEAAHRGNEQAATFLSDLHKVEAALGLHASVDAPAVPDVAAAPAPAADIAGAGATGADSATASVAETAAPTIAPAVAPTVAPAVATVAPLGDIDLTPAATPAVAATVDAVTGTQTFALNEAAAAPVAGMNAQFTQAAAWCSVSFEGSAVTGADCYTVRPTMGGNDYVLFVDAADTQRQVAVSLAADSVTVSTDSMLQESVVSEGISTLQAAPRVTVSFRGL